MRTTRIQRHPDLTAVARIAFATIVLALAGAATAQEVKRTELKKADLTGTNMEILVAVMEIPPGAMVPRHMHKGEEVMRVLEGATVQTLEGKKEIRLEPETTSIFPRDVPHGGFKVVGETSLKLLTVHILDKGSPFSVPAR